MNMSTKGAILLALILSFALTLPLFAGGAKEADQAAGDAEGKIVVWSFTDDMKTMAGYFTELYPDIEVEVVVIPNQDEIYLNKVNNTLRSKSDLPDVFTGERNVYKQFIDNGYWENLSQAPYNAEELMKDTVPYVDQISRDNDGNVVTLSWQATPGGLYYRRSIARDVLGTDDPAEVSKWTSDMERFQELGEKIKAYYGGEKYLMAGGSDMTAFVYYQRSEPYIQGNKLVIPESLVDYMKNSKQMYEQGLVSGVQTWDPAWFSAMADESVFSFILPTWGLHYVLKGAAEPEANEGKAEFTGDWALAIPPVPYSWGGTFLGINKYSKNKALAWEFVKFLGNDPRFLKAWAKDTGDFVSNIRVVEEIKGDFADPFLGGQNHYELFYEEAKKIDVSYIGPWDFQIQNAWDDQVILYTAGKKDYPSAIEDFKAAVLDFLPGVDEVVVED